MLQEVLKLDRQEELGLAGKLSGPTSLFSRHLYFTSLILFDVTSLYEWNYIHLGQLIPREP